MYQDKIFIGLVANCKRLNIREGPTVDSTEDFYKVRTAAGIEGFCMKKFIAFQP